MSPDPTLAAAAAAGDALRAAEIARLTAVLDWAVAHPAADEDSAAWFTFSSDDPLLLGGPGCPLVGSFAVCELGAALGMSTDAVESYLARALELRHRLPRLFARVIAGQVPIWRAGRIADSTMALPVCGAAFVDSRIAYCAHHCSWAQLERLIEDATARFDPATAAAQAAAAAERRHATVHLADPGRETAGTVELSAILDYADALDLENALASRATQLADLGSTDTLDVRRSLALGDLARHQLTLDLEAGSSGSDDLAAGAGRAVTIHAHLDSSDVARLDHPGGRLALVEQIASWCGAATKVIIKPVIDLRTTLATSAYAIPERIRDHIRLTHPVCVFPGCTRRAARCDIDHRIPWPAGDTSTDNLAPLCRRHHRLKTHGGWTYQPLDPPEGGIAEPLDTGPPRFLWTSPTGNTYASDLTPTPA